MTRDRRVSIEKVQVGTCTGGPGGMMIVGFGGGEMTVGMGGGAA